ncbi:hypothetical protein G7Y89_g14097 [Cudoniella acicularis]|uniref:Uncharacterized protein n=1 Tax=Cudoniella acicularis TaxID=354080 RepID=A0A8H4R7A0_9HELO|nr:hypothetical protein G7Y89_g14097 [Cudoniella acicularis]
MKVELVEFVCVEDATEESKLVELVGGDKELIVPKVETELGELVDCVEDMTEESETIELVVCVVKELTKETELDILAASADEAAADELKAEAPHEAKMTYPSNKDTGELDRSAEATLDDRAVGGFVVEVGEKLGRVELGGEDEGEELREDWTWTVVDEELIRETDDEVV